MSLLFKVFSKVFVILMKFYCLIWMFDVTESYFFFSFFFGAIYTPKLLFSEQSLISLKFLS